MLKSFYRIFALCFFTTIGILIVANIAYMFLGYDHMKALETLPFLIRLPFGVLGAFSAFGILALWLGMIWHCAFTSNLPAWPRTKWLLLLVLTNMLGALLYYYLEFNNRHESLRAEHVGNAALR